MAQILSHFNRRLPMTKRSLFICAIIALNATHLFADLESDRLQDGLNFASSAVGIKNHYTTGVKQVTFEPNHTAVNRCVNAWELCKDSADDCWRWCKDFIPFTNNDGPGYDPKYQHNFDITIRFSNNSKITFEGCTIYNRPYDQVLVISTSCKDKSNAINLEHFLKWNEFDYYNCDRPMSLDI